MHGRTGPHQVAWKSTTTTLPPALEQMLLRSLELEQCFTDIGLSLQR